MESEVTRVPARLLDPHAEERLARTDGTLARKAVAVLDENWMGHATRASASLYPHQWSWDSACIAFDYSGCEQERSEAELPWLFAGQGAKGFLHELMPKLVAWHEYLYRERTRGDGGLVEIWHPWESGMDNSPLWDDALARISPPPEAIPAYERVDVEFVDAAQRPTDADYDRYAYLVKLYRERGYDSRRIREDCPFIVRDVLFNSLLVQSNRDLAEIARVLGTDADPFETWAEWTAASLDAELWDESEGLYLDYDVRAGAHIRARTAAGLSPLYADRKSVV